MNASLAGRRILLTRPIDQAQSLLVQLQAQGANAGVFPGLRIVLQTPAEEELVQIEKADLIIFVSANAVRGLAPHASSIHNLQNLRFAAIGHATARALCDANLEPALSAPAPYNSEAFLALDELQALPGQRIIIVRGQSGRELLKENLQQRGAEVRYLQVYRRDPPDQPLSFADLACGDPELICITSTEIAANLLECVAPDDSSRLLNCPLLAGNARIAEACRTMKYALIGGVAEHPGDDAMLEAIHKYFAQTPAVP